ncbi:WD40 repeat-like protein [Rozella allomycis CSF55]|uniref:WD40 repeat-like protein n=1 Tax=Rozella allomycis (strain CSF55) TaxID=988480 RepID=A0A075AYW6_ROZAC|nr:hypothetical protein O9G_002470 [Rozella allomycis CSF55]RKP20851.1 WD40 repeat-like protein [Rozella allomycis CSF55]|eukprot:EPZ33907.1 hypothetical protein O9G_002470 [Rozella allomycis CSF55]
MNTFVFDSPLKSTSVNQPRYLRVQNLKKKQQMAADRFIPSNSAEMGHLNFEKDEEKMGKNEYNKNLQDSLAESDNTRILAYRPPAPQKAKEDLRSIYKFKPNISIQARKPTRNIPTTPEKVLDAPDLLDDYYLNLLDWSSENVLAVALNQTIYLWNASSGTVEELLTLGGTDYVSSVKWTGDGSYLAVGTSSAQIQLWDTEKLCKMRTMTGHSSRIPSLSWNNHILTSGARDGNIFHSDVRISNHHVSTLNGHSQEVCGLQWSPDGTQLASGGNDNIVNIWDSRSVTPKFSKSQHNAAVKALAWCPWQNNLLASGGGSCDQTIRFWNTQSGACLSSIDAGSQVCGILFSEEHREIITSHGYSDNQLSIWKYPSMTKVADLYGHSSRILHMAISPDGQTVVSAAADENLKFWKCFESSKKMNTLSSLSPSAKFESKMKHIR